MKVRDIMVKEVVFADFKDVASSALAKMKAKNISQIIVKENGMFTGIVELKNIVTKDIDTSKTKVGTLMKKSGFVKPDDDVLDAARSIISNGTRALPVMEGGRVSGIISETDIIGVADKFMNTESPITGIISKSVYARKGDNIGKIRHMMLNENVSRVPIVDEGKVVGVVGTIDLAKAAESKKSFEARSRTRDTGFKEKTRVEGIKAETIMSKAVTVKMDEKIKNVIKLLQRNEQVIVDSGETYIITPKDIIELFLSTPTKNVYVQVTGMQEEGMEFQSEMDSITTKFVQKVGKSFRDIQGLIVHVETYHKQGPRSKYSIRARLITENGIFVSHSLGWNPIDVIQEAFRKLENEIRHHMGKKSRSFKTKSPL
ncbi:MAG: CBS domain-containing protein [Candidatus Aenigmarchaeota archaeon]|nr:CBS domain-containing protein [Candidatus Aenigmarchaeota archaeon]